MKHLFIYAYKMGSRSASNLSRTLGVPQIRHEKSAFIGGSHKTVINWGSSNLPAQVTKSKVLNGLDVVRLAGNKLNFFRHMKTVSDKPNMVPWTEDVKEAQAWGKKNVVFSRTSLTGHSGHGIIVSEPGEALPEAPLYTKYIPKDSEWRLHFMGDTCFYVQRKIKDPSVEQPKTWKIRSHNNGFIFQHNDLEVPEDVTKQATLAFKASKLDFGGVDVICNKKGVAYVLEINTACGLIGESVQRYSEAFKQYIGGQRQGVSGGVPSGRS